MDQNIQVGMNKSNFCNIPFKEAIYKLNFVWQEYKRNDPLIFEIYLFSETPIISYLMPLIRSNVFFDHNANKGCRIILRKENKRLEIANGSCIIQMQKIWEWLEKLMGMIPNDIIRAESISSFLLHFLSNLDVGDRLGVIDEKNETFIASCLAYKSNFIQDKEKLGEEMVFGFDNDFLVEYKNEMEEKKEIDPLIGLPLHENGRNLENLTNVFDKLNEDDWTGELLLSFGTSNFGSAGHLGFCVRDLDDKNDPQYVYSANFNADKSQKLEKGYYNKDLIMKIPKQEYLYGKESSISPLTTFGLDYGECYKRTVLGIRIYGFKKSQIEKIKKFYEKINDDFTQGKDKEEYHRGEIKYDYTHLNCAKSVAACLRYGIGFPVPVHGNTFLTSIFGYQLLFSHTPNGTAKSIIECLSEFGFQFDVVLYKKYSHSEYIDPHDEAKVMFMHIPNKFPSLKNLDFLEQSTNYDSFDILYLMYLYFHLGKYSFVISDDQLVLESSKIPFSYDISRSIALNEARKNSKYNFQKIVRAFGIKITHSVDNKHLYNFEK